MIQIDGFAIIPSLPCPPPIGHASLAARASMVATDQDDEATPFQSHLLSLLSTISAHPSPSFPFGQAAALISTSTDDTLPAAGVLLEEKDALPPFKGSKTITEEFIESQIRELGLRVWEAERNTRDGQVNDQSHQGKVNAMAQSDRGILHVPGDLPTPAYTPQDVGDVSVSHFSTCPTCSCGRSQPPSHPLAVSLSTPAAHISTSAQRDMLSSSNLRRTPPISVTSSSTWGSQRESAMSAEKELELLKAQVQDIARVCKVRHFISARSS